ERQVEVPSTSTPGKTYTLTLKGPKIRCSCPAFFWTYRQGKLGNCDHIKIWLATRNGKITEHPSVPAKRGRPIWDLPQFERAYKYRNELEKIFMRKRIRETLAGQVSNTTQ
ncbi:MAG: hypothetical protein MN733_29965, partial [Nitrososphaera sp.]|nr:hypothetical protein [Nitrososphaera sp.]